MSSKTGDKTEGVSLLTEKRTGRGKHPNSQSNLQPFEKGVSGNPDGRPHKYAKLKKALMKYADRKIDGWRLERSDSKDAVLQEIWYRASEGSIAHFKVLAELGCLDEES
jgi:hypothetical protein